MFVSTKRDLTATRRFFTQALQHSPAPTEVATDRAPAYPRVLDDLLPAACHVTEQYRNNPIEADHGSLKSRLRPMRGLKRRRSVRVISAGHCGAKGAAACPPSTSTAATGSRPPTPAATTAPATTRPSSPGSMRS